MFLSWVDQVDLSGIHIAGTLIGVMLAVYASHAMWQDDESNRDCRLVRYGRRFMYPVLALFFLWSLDYANIKGWKPWAPDVGIILAIDFIMLMRILALRNRRNHVRRRGWSRPLGVDGGAGEL